MTAPPVSHDLTMTPPRTRTAVALDIVGPDELLEITTANSKRTVYVWIQRGQLPEPEARISGVPIWRRETIETWARDCGRLR